MKKILGIGALASVMLISCNKDQGTVNKLNGEWKFTKLTFGGVDVPLADAGMDKMTIDFADCKLKDGDCISYMKNDGVAVDTSYYIVAEKGTLFISMSSTGVAQDTMDLELTSSTEMTLSGTEDGVAISYSAEKL